MGCHGDHSGSCCRYLSSQSSSVDVAQSNGIAPVGSALVESCPDIRDGCVSRTRAVFARREMGSPGNECRIAGCDPDIPGGNQNAQLIGDGSGRHGYDHAIALLGCVAVLLCWLRNKRSFFIFLILILNK